MIKEERLAKVWERRDETSVNQYANKGYDIKKLKKLLSEYDLTVEDFLDYGRQQVKLGVNDD